MVEVYSVYAVLVENTIFCMKIKSKLIVAFLMALSIYRFGSSYGLMGLFCIHIYTAYMANVGETDT